MYNAKSDNLKPGLGKQNLKIMLRFLKSGKILVQEPNSENCLDLDLIFAAPPCEKVIIVPDASYITFAIRKLMLDIQSAGSFQNIGLRAY